MISLLLLPLLLLPSVQGQTCDMAGLEERLARMEERMDERVEEMKVHMKEEMEAKMEKRMAKRVEERLARVLERFEERVEQRVEEPAEKIRKKEEEMEAKLVAVEAKLEETEAVLRKELASKEEMGSVVTQGLRDLPYLTLCAFQDTWTSASSTITYDSFLTDFNNGDRPGGADGQLDLGTGVFNCLRDGIYRIDFSGWANLDPAEQVQVFLYHNGVEVPESHWAAYSPGTIGGRLQVPGSRSLVSVHLPVPPTLTSLLQMLPLKLGDTLELRTAKCTGELYYLVLCIELADQGVSATP